MSDRLLVALATYNERDNIVEMIDEVLRFASDAQVLVIDDNSPDGTADLVVAHRQYESRVLLMRREGKLGLGTAMLAAFRYAIDYQYEWLLVLDADGSHPPEFIPALREAVAKNSDSIVDVVIGSRYVCGGRVTGLSPMRRLMSRAINCYARCLLRLSTRDNSGSFRLYRVETLAKVPLNCIVSTGYSFFEEILFRLKHAGARFAEVPITFAPRRAGTSKINLREAAAALWTIFCLAWERRL